MHSVPTTCIRCQEALRATTIREVWASSNRFLGPPGGHLGNRRLQCQPSTRLLHLLPLEQMIWIHGKDLLLTVDEVAQN